MNSPILHAVIRKTLLRFAFCALALTASPVSPAQSITVPSGYVPPSGDPEQLFSHSLGLFYAAKDEIHGRELWLMRSIEDPPIMLGDLTVGMEDSTISELFDLGDKVSFRTETKQRGMLWITDGTPKGTIPVDFGNPAYHGFAYPIALQNNSFLIGLEEEFDNVHLWTIDLETRLSRPVGGQGTRPAILLRSTIALPNSILYGGSLGQRQAGLWISDGTDEGTQELLRMYQSPTQFVRAGEITYFQGSTQDNGWELWKTDGTSDGTRMVKDIWPGPSHSSPGEFVHLEGTTVVYFAAQTSEFGRELWKSDGTTEGTKLVADILPGTGGSNPYKLTVLGTQLVYIAVGEGMGKELWTTGLVDESTNLIKDIYPGPIGSNPYAFSTMSNLLYFSADDPEHGQELWRTSGYPGNTELVSDIYPGPGHSMPYFSIYHSGRVLFAAEHPMYGRELWRSDGTRPSTVMVRDLLQDGLKNPSSSPQEITSTPNLLFFAADDLKHGMELWCSDGTGEGTVMVRDIFSGRPSSDPKELTAIGDLVFFRADNGTHGTELWVSDGTERGTRMVEDIAINGDSAPRELTALGDKLLFVAYTPEKGDELWIADRNSAKLVSDIRAGAEGANPKGLTAWNGRVYFRADDGIHGEELWSSDGTVKGTRIVTDIVAVPSEQAKLSDPVAFQEDLYFSSLSDDFVVELWKLTQESPNPTLIGDSARNR